LPRKAFDYINEHPAAISVPALGISSAGLVINTKKQNKNIELQNKQLEAMSKLTNSLNKVDKTVKNSLVEKDNKNNRKKSESVLANLFENIKKNNER
jgi:Na+/phosphate symporter